MSKDPIVKLLSDLASAPYAFWRDAEGTIRRTVKWLEEKERISKEEAIGLVEDLLTRSAKTRTMWEERLDEFVSQKIRAIKIPRREELVELRKRVQALIERAERLEDNWRER